MLLTGQSLRRSYIIGLLATEPKRVRGRVPVIDTITAKPLSVFTEDNSAPYILVPVNQLDIVTGLLTKNRVPHWVDDEAISVDGKPEVAFIDLSPETDPKDVQTILDSVP